MNADNHKSELEQRGYLIIEDLLRPDEIAQCRAEIDRLLASLDKYMHG